MSTARDGLSTSVVNGKIYAIGGAIPAPLSVIEEYDPQTDTWTKKSDMPTARWGHSASLVDEKIYVIGGRIGTGGQVPAFSIVEQYDPATDIWTKKADMPTARWGLSTGVVNGKIYAIGGSTNESTALSIVEEYDLQTDTWMRKPNVPTARWYFSTSEVNDKIYAIGGWVANAVNTSSVEEFDVSFKAVEAENRQPTMWGEIKAE